MLNDSLTAGQTERGRGSEGNKGEQGGTSGHKGTSGRVDLLSKVAVDGIISRFKY